MEPKLRSVNKAVPPYKINDFPKQFIRKLAEDVVYTRCTKSAMSLTGDEWEQIFANCIGADWKPSNVGLDDVVLDNCCWGAKTVFASSNNLANQKSVRLISGRNSPSYSFNEDTVVGSDPNHLGELVLGIWNERVSAVRQQFKFVRTVVLVKKKDYSEFLVFETDTIRYDPELYVFQWNPNNNLVGMDKKSGEHKFTWQPHGSQFTIIESIPENRLHLTVDCRGQLDKYETLKTLGFDDSWYSVVK